jgi:hypothetical protein
MWPNCLGQAAQEAFQTVSILFWGGAGGGGGGVTVRYGLINSLALVSAKIPGCVLSAGCCIIYHWSIDQQAHILPVLCLY